MLFAKKIKIISVLLIAILIFSCKKTQPAQVSPVANVAVNVIIYPNDPLYFKIQTPGGWVYYPNAGVDGLIIYRKSSTEFSTMDRASTYYPTNAAALARVQADNFTCIDTISGSKWQIVDGVVMTGPATYPLKKYQNTYDGNALRIFN
jgi:hypothetical protein